MLSSVNESSRIVAGVDVGSVGTKVVLFDVTAQAIVATGIVPTGWDSQNAALQGLEQAYATAHIQASQVEVFIGTGYGRIALPFVQKTLTEISCHGRAALFMCPEARMVLDIGGQDSKAIKIAPNGSVLDFVMNDKCAAGTGRFLQVLSGILQLPLTDLSQAAGMGQAVPISSMCAVFAESEIVGLLAQGTKPEDVAAGVFVSMAKRMRSLVGRMGGNVLSGTTSGMCIFTGGLATSSVFASILSKELGFALHVPEYAQHMGALGAALFAADMVMKNK